MRTTRFWNNLHHVTITFILLCCLYFLLNFFKLISFHIFMTASFRKEGWFGPIKLVQCRHPLLKCTLLLPKRVNCHVCVLIIKVSTSVLGSDGVVFSVFNFIHAWNEMWEFKNLTTDNSASTRFLCLLIKKAITVFLLLSLKTFGVLYVIKS